MPRTDSLTTAAADATRELLGVEQVDAVVVLGSGWATLADRLGTTTGVLDVVDLPGFRLPTAEGHGSQMRHVTTPSGRTALVFLGRTHLYEGFGAEAAVRPILLGSALGADRAVLTNACGAVDPNLAVGDSVVFADHLNFSGHSPLFGPSSVDLTDCYDPALRAAVLAAVPEVREGIYAMMPGPHFETPAETRWLRSSGADISGMSTVLEAIMARFLGMSVCALAVVSNPAPESPHPPAREYLLGVVARRAEALAPAVLAAIDA